MRWLIDELLSDLSIDRISNRGYPIYPYRLMGERKRKRIDELDNLECKKKIN